MKWIVMLLFIIGGAIASHLFPEMGYPIAYITGWVARMCYVGVEL